MDPGPTAWIDSKLVFIPPLACPPLRAMLQSVKSRVDALTLASFTALFAACQSSQPAPQIAPPPTPIPAVIAALGAEHGMTNARPRCMTPVTFTFADTSNAKIGSVGFCDTGTPAEVLVQPGRIDFSAKTFGGFVAQDPVALAKFLP
jgi:hypothetical protein